jgi:HemY protein
MPLSIRVMRGIAAIYFAAMIDVGEGQAIENELVQALSANWNSTLIILYGNVISENPLMQLGNSRAMAYWS